MGLGLRLIDAANQNNEAAALSLESVLSLFGLVGMGTEQRMLHSILMQQVASLAMEEEIKNDDGTQTLSNE